MDFMPLVIWSVFWFLMGAVVGSFLNVCISRLPMEKSFIWPGSRCSHCLQAIRWYDNIPLISYWKLRGRCRTCGSKFSIRYFIVELATALGFVGLFHAIVVQNIHHMLFHAQNVQNIQQLNNLLQLQNLQIMRGAIPWEGLVVFLFHAILFSFLLAAAVCDFDQQAIPLSLTVTGTVVGLIAAVLFAWPWPYIPAAAVPALAPGQPWLNPRLGPKTGLYPWPVWGPLPAWLQPGGNWQTGLATGLAGMLMGTLMLRGVRFCFGIGMGAEYMEESPDPDFAVKYSWFGSRAWAWLQRVGGKALGIGDADLMMMAGSFLGWQAVVLAFFASILPGLLMGLAQIAVRGGNAMPFGPALAIGVMMVSLGWDSIGPAFQPLFFDGVIVLSMVGVCAVLMVGGGYLIRMFRFLRN
jgi:leader peptidase (prepilin peptidase)/N-methyltransferase